KALVASASLRQNSSASNSPVGTCSSKSSVHDTGISDKLTNKQSAKYVILFFFIIVCCVFLYPYIYAECKRFHKWIPVIHIRLFRIQASELGISQQVINRAIDPQGI